ncbi:hypothetical protein OPV22_000305 [Ensete ventricosum]|uniref:Uncharacterized protein n=1 Tax=Ensete ventricosum TaxID=4639 RepID=A0AAV8Q8X5_ENSVE|nr:hypothetical protein OPV22_000305 [Ensete ventricosum]
MLSANVMVNRSSLEIFLDEIRQRDERPKDLPPALPLRPTSRGRLPRWRRPLPVHLNLERGAPRSLLSNSVEGEDEQTPNNERDVEQLVESPCLITPDLVRHEKRMQIDDGSGSPALSLPPPVGGVIKDAMNEVSGMEDARNQTLQGIIWVQESFRGVRVCSQYQQLKKGATVLQSFVRGESARHNFEVLKKRWWAAILIQQHLRRCFAKIVFNNQRKDIIFLQSVIRGRLARKRSPVLKKMEVLKSDHTYLKNREVSMVSHVQLIKRSARDSPQLVKDTESEHPQINLSVLAQLQSQVCKVEAELRDKEEENAVLKWRLQEYEMRWSEYESKMIYMERTWQKQLISLQMNFADARKSFVLKDMTNKPRQQIASQIDHYYEAEDKTPEVTVAKPVIASTVMPVRHNGSSRNAAIQLTIEFGQHRKVFHDDAGACIEAKSEQLGASMNPCKEPRKLKARFASWRKWLCIACAR